MSNYFDDKFVGQAEVKSQLGFYLDAFKETRVMPFLGFFSPKGYGKTAFAKRTMEHVTQKDGTPRTNIPINTSTIRNNEAFFENIFARIIIGNDVNILFDEAHNLPKDVAQLLLTVCDIETNPIREVRYAESLFMFDFTRISFFFATTEPDKLFPPLKDRMQPIEFRPYTRQDISDMVDLYCKDIIFGGDAKNSVVDSIRDNPRSVVKRAADIERLAFGINKSPFFGDAEWKQLADILGINPLGLENTEISVLNVLSKRGPCSLQTLSNVCGMSRSAVRTSVENRLIKCGLIEIDGKRRLTDKGIKLVNQLKNSGKLAEIF